MKKKIPIEPTKTETTLSIIYVSLCCVLWLFLIGGIIHLVSYYVLLLRTKGLFSQESIKICTYVIVGAFMFLFIYRDKAKEIFKVKKVLR